MNLKTLQNTPSWEWPKNAGKIFKDALTNRGTPQSDRVIAAELAGDLVVINDDLAGTLLKIVADRAESDELRAKSAISLGPVLEQADIEEFEDPDEIPITESTFLKIQDTLRNQYLNESNSKELRRRILEASVRAPQDWHQEAIAAAYASGDRDWKLTAVFGMRWVQGFDSEILDALKSTDPEIQFEAVSAAGENEVDGAWMHVAGLVENARTPKPLLLAAIDAVSCIRPKEARDILVDLTDSEDEEIAEAAREALEMSEGLAGMDEDDDEEENGDWVN